jgi:hypothetical protein
LEWIKISTEKKQKGRRIDPMRKTKNKIEARRRNTRGPAAILLID